MRNRKRQLQPKVLQKAPDQDVPDQVPPDHEVLDQAPPDQLVPLGTVIPLLEPLSAGVHA